mmetsp:Transcript_26916/g.79337  ORF Transcript_26916/g.79337 Transcript_26916/m.79337 type:complete len:285 (+) Transcript_26916:242-1096(+)
MSLRACMRAWSWRLVAWSVREATAGVTSPGASCARREAPALSASTRGCTRGGASHAGCARAREKPRAWDEVRLTLRAPNSSCPLAPLAVAAPTDSLEANGPLRRGSTCLGASSRGWETRSAPPATPSIATPSTGALAAARSRRVRTRAAWELRGAGSSTRNCAPTLRRSASALKDAPTPCAPPSPSGTAMLMPPLSSDPAPPPSPPLSSPPAALPSVLPPALPAAELMALPDTRGLRWEAPDGAARDPARVRPAGMASSSSPALRPELAPPCARRPCGSAHRAS